VEVLDVEPVGDDPDPNEDVPLVVELRNGGPCVMVRPERA